MAVFSRARNRRSAQSGDPAPNPFAQRGFLLSVGLLALLVLVAVSTGFGRAGNHSAKGASPNPPPTGSDAADALDQSEQSAAAGPTAPGPTPLSTAATIPPASAGSCPTLSDKDQRVPTSAPTSVTWGGYRGAYLPSSVTAGPARSEGETVRCFAHTPTGALIAAAQISTRFIISPDWRTLLANSVVADTNRTSAFQKRQADEVANGPAVTGPTDEPASADLMQIIGFRVVDYNATSAVVQLLRGGTVGDTTSDETSDDLATSAPPDQGDDDSSDTGSDSTSSVYSLLWQHGDWKLKVQDDGSAAVLVQSGTASQGISVWGVGANT